jgi:hypothetical protein
MDEIGIKNSYKSFRGPCSDKINTSKITSLASAMKTAVVSQATSQKRSSIVLLQANVPVYWGPDNVTDFIPADCFIDAASICNT